MEVEVIPENNAECEMSGKQFQTNFLQNYLHWDATFDINWPQIWPLCF